MLSFSEWADQFGVFLSEARRVDTGEEAFIDSTNRGFREEIKKLLDQGKFTDPRNKAEAEEIVSNPSFFDYARSIMKVIGREAGGLDVTAAATNAFAKLYEKVFKRLEDNPDITWEMIHPMSADRRGIRGTVLSRARTTLTDYLDDITKRRSQRATYQMGQLGDTERKFDPAVQSPEIEEFETSDTLKQMINYVTSWLQEAKKRQEKGEFVPGVQYWEKALAMLHQGIPSAAPGRSKPSIQDWMAMVQDDPEMEKMRQGAKQMNVKQVLQQAYKNVTESIRYAVRPFSEWVQVRHPNFSQKLAI